MHNDVSILAELALNIARESPEQSLALRLCRASVKMLGADGGAVALTPTAMQRFTVSTTSATAARIDELEEVLGDGPTQQAYLTNGLVILRVDRDGEGLPTFAQAAAEVLGPMTIYAYPMRIGSSVLGVLTVYCAAPRLVTRRAEEAQILANILGGALLRDTDEHDGASLGVWAGRARVHQATGMVVAQLGLTPEDALTLIRAHAYAQATTVDDVAVDIVERRLDFSQRDPHTFGDQLDGRRTRHDDNADDSRGTETP